MNFLTKFFGKKTWGRKEKQAYQPSSEEERVTEEKIRNTNRLISYYLKKDGHIKIGT